MSKLKSVILPLILASAPAHVLAQDGTEQNENEWGGGCCNLAANRIDIVVTATGFSKPRDRSGHQISVITQDDLARSQVATITDILPTIPGLHVAQRGSAGGQSSVFIRGGNSSQTLVLIDGVRVNDPSSPNGLFDFGALTTGNIDRVEILRGPNSIIWGSQAIGGIVNISHAEPSDRLSVNARAEYGSYDTSSTAANISGKLGIVGLSAGGSIFHTDGISAIRAGTEKDGYRNGTANLRARIGFSENFSLDLRGFYTKGRVRYDAAFSATPDTLSDSRDRSLIGYAGLNANFLDGRFQNRVAYTLSSIRRIGSDPATPVLFTNYNIFRFLGRTERLEYRGNFKASDTIAFTFGLENEKTRASTFFPADGGTQPDRAKTSATSGYAQLELKPLDGLTLTGGLRHDDLSSYGKRTSFGGNLAYALNGANTVLRATYAEGFRAPTLIEALFPFGNPALQAEEAKSFDAGIEQWLLDRRMMIGLTAFKRTSRNQITYNFATFQSENIERVKASGVEAEISISPTNRLSIRGQFSLINARDRSAGFTFNKRLERRPSSRGSVSVDWNSPWKLAIGATIVLSGVGFEDRSNSIRLDGYALSSIRANYPISDSISIYGRVENLFDVNYETVKGYGTLGRNAHVGVRAKF